MSFLEKMRIKAQKYKKCKKRSPTYKFKDIHFVGTVGFM